MAKKDIPSLNKKTSTDNNYNLSLDIPKLNLEKIPPIPKKSALIIIGVVILLLIMISTINYHGDRANQTEDTVENITPTTTIMGNTSIGYVVKEGPYGNTSSNVHIAYILGVHPREKGAHKLMEQAFKEKADMLQYSYDIYKVNVTEDSTDFSQSRLNGQKLANEYIVPRLIHDNYTFAVDSHYSNGFWGVSNFVFTPNENNILSSEIGHAISENFDWITYFVPENPTSPQYVTGPLNNGGVSAIVYEAYTEDTSNVTLEHDRQIVDFIDKWNFTSNMTETSE